MQSTFVRSLDGISIFDLSRFMGGAAALRQVFSREFVTRLATENLVGFEGHPACTPEVDIADWVKRLFSLPLDQYAGHGMEAFRGYSAGFRDQFMWHIGPELSADSPLTGRMPENKWVAELPGFKQAVMSMFGLLEDLSRQIMSMLALGLGAPEEQWLEAMDHHSSVFRFIYFPARGDFAAGGIRLAEHHDASMFAILPPASGGGLEVLRNGGWFDVPSHEGIISAYPGQMTEHLSNGRIKAVKHRVIASNHGEHMRLSFPFFMHPHPDFVLHPAAGSVEPGIGPLYPAMTVEELMTQYFQQYLDHQLDSGWARDVLSEPNAS